MSTPTRSDRTPAGSDMEARHGSEGHGAAPVPNFFVVGAFKSGTTALYEYLRQHSDVFLSPLKEPAYFVSEFRVGRLNPEWRRLTEADQPALARYLEHPEWGPHPRGVVTEWEDYLKLFKTAAPGQAIGEGSVGCLWSRTAADTIRERIPGARILMILRNPCDRAFSQYSAVSPHLLKESFSDAIRRSASSPPAHLFDSLDPFLDFGMYSEQVARYLARFHEDRVRVYLYDDLVRDAEGLVRDVFRFLGVRDDVPLDLSVRHNESRVPRFPRLDRYVVRPAGVILRDVVPVELKRAINAVRYRPRGKMRMTNDDRRFLIQYYEDDIRRLESVIGRDLSDWLI